MSEHAHEPHTTQLHAWIGQMRAGDLAARDELLRGVSQRLEALARHMLRRFPVVARWEETGDVLTPALLRLLDALEVVTPESMRRFYGLAAEQLRRQLLDLARRYRGPQGLGANQASWPGAGPEGRAPEPVDPRSDRDDLERWCAFHEEVERLPTEEREVVGLVFYHGWSQAEVAELFGVTVRTVQRWWQSALLRLHASWQEDAGLT
jgi:RNA polymerase sigma-70 factor (ECF subfamily)